MSALRLKSVMLISFALLPAAMQAKTATECSGTSCNTTTTTSSTTLAVDYVSTPAVLNVDSHSTTLVVMLDGKQVSSQTQALPYTDPAVQTTVIQAEATLTAMGAGYTAPVMTAMASVLQSTVTAQPATWTGTCSTFEAGTAVPPYGSYTTGPTFSSIVSIGPQTISIGDCESQSLVIPAGAENINTVLITTLNIPPVTTVTNLISQTYTIYGTTGSIAELSPSSLAFPVTAGGATSGELFTTLSNPGKTALTGIVLSLGGAHPGNFALTPATNCGATLAPSSSCTIAVSFTPSAAASFTATLTVSSNAAGSPQTVVLSGIGGGAQVQFAPARIRFIVGTTGSAGNSGDGGAATGALISGGSGMAIDRAGNLYFSDSAYNTIRRIDTAGKITAYAGLPVSGSGSYSGDNGAATAAGLNAPGQIALDESGNLYIADTLNNIIRKVTPGGVISTFAGSYGSGVCGYAGEFGPANGGPSAIRGAWPSIRWATSISQIPATTSFAG